MLTDKEILVTLGEDKANDPELWDDLLADARKVITAYEVKLREQKPVCWLHTEFGGAKFINFIDQTPGVGWAKQGLFTHPAPIPEGYALVPIEPTTHMVNEGLCGCMDNDVTVCIWKKMLAAARSE